MDKISRRKIKTDQIIPFELAHLLTALSQEIKRQIGILVGREGTIHAVIVGDQRQIMIPDLSQLRPGKRQLRGIRLIHTHLKSEALSQDDLTDLALLRLDLIAAIGIQPDGTPGAIFMAHLLPPSPSGKQHEIHPPKQIHQLEFELKPFLDALEAEFDLQRDHSHDTGKKNRAILISASKASRIDQEAEVDELSELVKSAALVPIGQIIQRPKRFNAKYLMGEGKLKEVVINAMQQQADLLIFNQNLSPLQIRSIAEVTEMKVLDRTQLILDIFAQRALTREAKVQVELAQLRYRLPRLSQRSTALSRLTGGIGGRGPGETRLEIDLRRARDRIAHLEREHESLAEARTLRRQKRTRNQIPIASIVGYTNAGKSTLLNQLTESHVKTKDLLFATLDTATRRLRFPREREVILTDTVGFIQSLPPALLAAFRSTLDELRDAHLLIHLADISNPRLEQQIQTVETLLKDLGLSETPCLLVLNKIDRVDPETAQILCKRHRALGITALNPKRLIPLLNTIERDLWKSENDAP
ncbi:Ribosome LSU-associated GTP-binding protein HflX [hydrothermal vent metagenome]|uniref:Ribosome LSU-associated GTP-binding protein HflX n=1 Tax=hydrothermal vent metagenome TaxID=652676 RepID=A0A3B1CD30_9ZZZZ